MRVPIAWVWLSTFTRLFVRGEPYLEQRPWDAPMSWFVAGVVASACWKIRRGR